MFFISSVKGSLGTAAPSPQQGRGGEEVAVYRLCKRQCNFILMYKSCNQSDRHLRW